jgi:hypothetical protein
VAHLRLGGMRGKQSTPTIWLGGTGESSMVGKQKREHQGARGCHPERVNMPRYVFILDEC